MATYDHSEYPMVLDDKCERVRVGQTVTRATVLLYVEGKRPKATLYADGEPYMVIGEEQISETYVQGRPILLDNYEIPLYETFERGSRSEPAAWIYRGRCEKDGHTNRDMNIAQKQYICSAFRSSSAEQEEFNRKLAIAACRRSMVYHGILPIAPHLYYPQFLDDRSAERGLGMDAGLALLRECQSIVVYVVDGEYSEGMRKEIDYATERLAMNPQIVNFTRSEAEEFIKYHIGRT